MRLILSLITSGSVKYIVYLILAIGLGTSLYYSYQNRLELERKNALYQYNINQLQQLVKDKEKQIQQLNEINKDKDAAVAVLQKYQKELEDKFKNIESNIDVETGKGNDRPSSNILKETIRRLGETK